jgi:hypothetical protein
MTTDHFSRAIKTRAKKRAEKNTPQDKERLKTTPMERGSLFTAMIRKATSSNKKAIKNGKSGTTQKSQSKTTTAMQRSAEASGASSDTTLYRRTRA